MSMAPDGIRLARSFVHAKYLLVPPLAAFFDRIPAFS